LLLSGGLSGGLSVAARDTVEVSLGREMTWEEFDDEVAAGVVFGLVPGAVRLPPAILSRLRMITSYGRMAAALRADAAVSLEVRPPLEKPGSHPPYSQMTQIEREAFQHSYRHSEELGLPPWKGDVAKAEALQKRFNDVVAYIRANATSVVVRERMVAPRGGTFSIPGGYQMELVAEYQATIHGTRYYYYATLAGKFVSAGKAK
jgi:hypothetical protein